MNNIIFTVAWFHSMKSVFQMWVASVVLIYPSYLTYTVIFFILCILYPHQENNL